MDDPLDKLDAFVLFLLERSFVDGYLEIFTNRRAVQTSVDQLTNGHVIANESPETTIKHNVVTLSNFLEKGKNEEPIILTIEKATSVVDTEPANDSKQHACVKQESSLETDMMLDKNANDVSPSSKQHEAKNELKIEHGLPAREVDHGDGSKDKDDEKGQMILFDNDVLEDAKEHPKIAYSTPVKQNPSIPMVGSALGAANVASKLSSNLAIMVGDLSGIDNDIYSEDLSSSGSSWHNQLEAGMKGNSWMPSTLELSDLEIESLDSYKLLSVNRSTKETSKISDDNVPGIGKEDIHELENCYEMEIRRLQLEKDELVAMVRSPKRGSALMRLKHLEEMKSDLQRRCLHSEGRNRQLTLEVDRLTRSCFDMGRRARLLETDKAILQQRNFTLDEERRKSMSELSSLQERLNESMSARRILEDELMLFKKKEFESSSRLSDSDTTIRELKDDLSSSKRDCANKNDVIRSINAQKQEIQENLNQALDQISNLEDASSQRTREKNLFHKLLEEYEVLYNQHRRIRNLYNEAMQKLDEGIVDDQRTRSQSTNDLSLKLSNKSSSLRKKWSMSPTSPSLREEHDILSFKETDIKRDVENLGFDVGEKNNAYHRPMGSSILSWDTSRDTNNNHRSATNAGKRDFGNKDAINPRSPLNSRFSETRHSYHSNDARQFSTHESNGSKHGSPTREKNWIVQNMNGITRFDVVFATPNSRYEQAEKDDQTGREDEIKVTSFEEQQEFKEINDVAKDMSAEILELENDLKKLSAEKNEIESQLSRLPINGSGRFRRSNAEKQELLEDRLDEVIKYIGNIRMTLKRHKAL